MQSGCTCKAIDSCRASNKTSLCKDLNSLNKATEDSILLFCWSPGAAMKMTSVLQQFRKQKYMIENTSIMIETYRNDILRKINMSNHRGQL